MKDKSDEEIRAQQEWIEQVYYGNCCSHPDDDCDMGLNSHKEKQKKSKESLKNSSSN